MSTVNCCFRRNSKSRFMDKSVFRTIVSKFWNFVFTNSWSSNSNIILIMFLWKNWSLASHSYRVKRTLSNGGWSSSLLWSKLCAHFIISWACRIHEEFWRLAKCSVHEIRAWSVKQFLMLKNRAVCLVVSFNVSSLSFAWTLFRCSNSKLFLLIFILYRLLESPSGLSFSNLFLVR